MKTIKLFFSELLDTKSTHNKQEDFDVIVSFIDKL